jgi:hypothetical protein
MLLLSSWLPPERLTSERMRVELADEYSIPMAVMATATAISGVR